jgi:ABC-type transport system involved in cytochrome bd biosynthesis fused ATPase/permease subunit
MKIELKNLCFKTSQKVIFEELDYTFSPRENYLISGPSACGKSSLLNMIAGMQTPSSGEILIDDHYFKNICDHRKNCQLLSQIPFMYPVSVKENLLYALNYHKIKLPTEAELKYFTEQLFPEGLGLNQEAKKLSVGQRHRLALIRSVLLKPKALLCDELTAGLDSESRRLSELFLQKECSEMTLIFISHVESSFENAPNFTRLTMNFNSLSPKK